MWPLAEISTRGPSVVRWEALLDYDETLAMAERLSKTYSRVVQTSKHTADLTGRLCVSSSLHGIPALSRFGSMKLGYGRRTRRRPRRA